MRCFWPGQPETGRDRGGFQPPASGKVELLNEQIAALTCNSAGCRRCSTTRQGATSRPRCRSNRLARDLNMALARVATEDRRPRRPGGRAEAANGSSRGGRGTGALPLGVLRPAARGAGRARGRADRRRPLRVLLRSAVRAGFGRRSSEPARRRSPGSPSILVEVADDIPPDIDWIIRVDGHTDDQQLSGQGNSATTGN